MKNRMKYPPFHPVIDKTCKRSSQGFYDIIRKIIPVLNISEETILSNTIKTKTLLLHYPSA
ncbi:MAG TPA: hypothetical protein PK358_00200 [Spirochaetota bacterium]|nr:hypothetical protein [Spirochaetota bacterium]